MHSWIQNFPCDQVACPCCYESLKTASIRPAPPAIEELLANLSCTQCNKQVKAGDLHNHLLSGCNLHTLDEQPVTEMHVAGSILRRHLQGENIITVPPGKQGGKVQCYTCTCLYTCMCMLCPLRIHTAPHNDGAAPWKCAFFQGFPEDDPSAK